MDPSSYTLTDKLTGNLAFKIDSFQGVNPFQQIQRNNFYSFIVFAKGKGDLKSSFSTISFSEKGICSFSPYQPYVVEGDDGLEGIAIHFHSDFFCIYRHQNEVASGGILFNNAYTSPFFHITDAEYLDFIDRIGQIKKEMSRQDLAQHELLILHLKIILINAIRIRVSQREDKRDVLENNKATSVLQDLIDAIELNFREKHKANDYAELMKVPGKTLARLTSKHLNKTLTDLISDRIIIEAKRDLYLTSKPVKEIAFALGFKDEHYFSRFFKKKADISPQTYREKVGEGREALLPK
jgi:AraC-like DNA-binding protein